MDVLHKDLQGLKKNEDPDPDLQGDVVMRTLIREDGIEVEVEAGNEENGEEAGKDRLLPHHFHLPVTTHLPHLLLLSLRIPIWVVEVGRHRDDLHHHQNQLVPLRFHATTIPIAGEHL